MASFLGLGGEHDPGMGTSDDAGLIHLGQGLTSLRTATFRTARIAGDALDLAAARTG